jgi:hypothetical protein
MYNFMNPALYVFSGGKKDRHTYTSFMSTDLVPCMFYSVTYLYQYWSHIPQLLSSSVSMVFLDSAVGLSLDHSAEYFQDLDAHAHLLER